MTDDPRVTDSAGEVVPNLCPDAPSTGSERGPNADSEAATRKRRGGPPKGNTNAGGASLDKRARMLLARAMKGTARAKRTARRKGYEAESRGIAEELRLAESYPMTAKRLQRALTDTAQEIDVCQALCDNRGRYEAKTGKLKPWYETVLRLRERDLSIIQKAIDDLRSLPGQKTPVLAAGALSITIAAEPAVEIPQPCEACGHVRGLRAGSAQPPPAGDLIEREADPPSVVSIASRGRVGRPAPAEVVTLEPVPVVVEVPRRVEHVGFDRQEREVEAFDPRRLQW